MEDQNVSSAHPAAMFVEPDRLIADELHGANGLIYRYLLRLVGSREQDGFSRAHLIK